MEFSTIAKAIAATRIHAAYALGAAMAECEALGAEAGMTASDLIPYADAVATRETLFIYDPDPGATPPYTNVPCKVCIDKVVMPNARFVDGPGDKWGIVLDYEAHDDRSQAETLDLVQHVADAWHARGMKVYLYTNPIDGTVFPLERPRAGQPAGGNRSGGQARAAGRREIFQARRAVLILRADAHHPGPAGPGHRA